MSNSVSLASAAAFFTVFILLGMTSLTAFSVLGLTTFVFFVTKFYSELGSKIEMRDLIIIIAILQWIVGPILAYTFNSDDQFYYMAVKEEVYMNYVFPASFLFIVGLYFPIPQKPINENLLLKHIVYIVTKQKNIDLLFIITGFIADFLIDFVPDSLRFFTSLISGSRFIGLYFLALSDRPNKWIYFALVIGSLIAASVGQAMFHDLLLWVGFLFVIITYIYRFSSTSKFMWTAALIFGVMIIQTVKQEYRKVIWVQNTTNIDKGQIFTSIVQNQLENTVKMVSNENIDAAINRINQGWIIARIMAWTPLKEPYADGETIYRGLEAAFLPRIIAENKAKAGGKENFQRFTGKKLRENTSMGLSPIGEAYANFGVFYGALFMLFLGLFYNVILWQLVSYLTKYPTLILFFPLMFLHVIKAEVDFAVVLNYLVKSIIVVALIFWSARQFFNIKL